MAMDPGLEKLEGTYLHFPQPGEKAYIKKQVEDSLAEFNPLFRQFARPKLQRGATIDKKIELKIEKDNVTLIHQNQQGTASLDVTLGVEVESKTEDLRHIVNWKSRELIRIDKSKYGGRSVNYRLDEDGKTLWIGIKMFGSQMKRPVVYTLKYIKKMVK